MKNSNKEQKSTFKIISDQLVVSTLFIAKHLNKPHAVILKKVRSTISSTKHIGNFIADTYIDATGRTNPMFFIDEKGFELLSIELNIPKNSAIDYYILSKLKSTSSTVKDDLSINHKTKKKDASNKLANNTVTALPFTFIKAEKPLPTTFEQRIDNEEKVNIGLVPRILNLPYDVDHFFNKLREHGIFCKERNEPAKEWLNAGYFQIKQKWVENNICDCFTETKVLVTNQGLEFLNRCLQPIH